jgi:glycosyltransferase involved in cell wall biosynthesis
MFLAKAFQTDTRVRQEAKSLVDANYVVSVIAWDRESEFEALEKVDGVTVLSFSHVNLRRSSALGLALGAMIFQVLLLLNALIMIGHLRRRPIIHAHDFNTLVPAWFLKRLRLCAALVYDCHELSYAAYSELFNPLMGAVVRIIEEECLRSVDAVITVSDPIAQYLRRFNRSVETVYNCPSSQDIPQLTKAQARVKLGLPQNAFIISHVGTIRYDHRLDLMLSVASAAGKSACCFLVVGGGPLAAWFRRKAREMGAARLIILPQVPRNTALLYTKASDLAWVVYRDPRMSLNSRIGMPWKFFESLACGVPIVVEDGTFRADLVRKLECGLVLESDEAGRISEIILSTANDHVRLERMRLAARRSADQVFNWEVMSSRLIALYSRLESSASCSK